MGHDGYQPEGANLQDHTCRAETACSRGEGIRLRAGRHRASHGERMRFWNRFRLRMRGGRLESELYEEIRLHREMLEEQFVREGTSRGDPSRAAARQLGNPSVVADLSRDEWAFPRLDAIWKDLKFAWRLMLRSPLLSGAAVLTVAFGVGANTTVLTVLETVLLNPLGMRHTEKVTVARVHIETLHMKHSTVSGVEFREIKSMQD